MATHELDQKLLARLAHEHVRSQPYVAGALFQILGLSIMLGPRLVSARKARIFLSTNDQDAILLLHQIMWLTRTGLQLLMELVFPVANTTTDARLKVFAAKLRASFYHILCLFRNNPPILLRAPLPLETQPTTQHRRQGSSPLAQRKGQKLSPKAQVQAGEDSSPPSANARRQKSGLRDPIQSMNSEVSYVTNPYANDGGPARSPAVGPPPGIPARRPMIISNNSTFLIPKNDYTGTTTTAFNTASKLAVDLLPGSAPLRLSVLLEQCAFLWDCLADHKASRDLARRTIRDVYRASDPISDADFEDARVFVATLGRMMRRKSTEMTPKFGSQTPPQPAPERMFERSRDELPPLPPTFGVHPLSQVVKADRPTSRPLTTFEEDTPHSTRTSGVVAYHRSDAPRPLSKTEMDPHDSSVTARPMAPIAPTSRYSRELAGEVPAPLSAPTRSRESVAAPQPATSSRREGHISDSSITTTPESFKVKRRPVPTASTSPPRREGGSAGKSSNPSTSASGPTPTMPLTPPETGPTPNPSGNGKRPGSPSDSPTPKARARG